jgi:hypothetical protein
VNGLLARLVLIATAPVLLADSRRIAKRLIAVGTEVIGDNLQAVVSLLAHSVVHKEHFGALPRPNEWLDLEA